MHNKVSPSYIIDLIEQITQTLYSKYASYKRVETYIKRWQQVDYYANDGYGDYPIYNFNIIYKEKEKIDVTATLNNASDDLIIQIAIDLGIEVVGIIYSIAKIESLDKHYYKNAKIIFDDAIKRVYDKPDESIGLANSALETIIKHILEQGKLNIKYNKKATLYDLTQTVLKGFKLFPSKDCIQDEINKIGSSLLCIAQSVETLRSEMTKFHGKDSSQYIVEVPLYAIFVVNTIATIGNFIISFYEKKYTTSDTENTLMVVSDENLINDDELPF